MIGPDSFLPRRVPLGDMGLPAPGEIHAWYLDLGMLATALQGALDGHHDGTGASSFTPGQMRFARRFFLRLLLGAYLGLPGKEVKVNRRNRGKPFLDATFHDEELHFSMAKSGNSLLIGFSSSHDLGVDLEQDSRKAHNALAVARRYFSPREALELAALPVELQDTAFLRTWACKEAVVKNSGHGIANQLCRFSVETDPQRPAAVVEFEDQVATDWSLGLLRPAQGLLGALAVRDRDVSLSTYRLLPASPAS